MKKQINKSSNALLSFFGFLLFLLTIMITSTLSIVVYNAATKSANGNLTIINLSVLGVILFGAIFCTIFDIIRRKHMVEKPVNKILEATKKISSGEFEVQIDHIKEYNKYNEFDLIFDNINLMAAELAKNEILKNDFVSNVSHEIKTPIAVIQTYAQALQDKKLSEEKKSEYLNGLIIQTKKLSDLVSNILKLNKLENQKIIPEIENFDLSEHLRTCILSFESLIEKKNLELICDIDELTITSSASLLEIAINNLISNAIKFTNDGGYIRITLKESFNYAVICVEDSGCGISNETGQHIFDKFYQGDTSRASEGNGLGLTLVKQVIDILGGEIYVESTLGKGSTFVIKLKKDL